MGLTRAESERVNIHHSRRGGDEGQHKKSWAVIHWVGGGGAGFLLLGACSLSEMIFGSQLKSPYTSSSRREQKQADGGRGRDEETFPSDL